jgi:uncharacterized damage-inducible protein DinB
MNTLPDRFRRWYDHERDSNAKIVQMLRSVPAEKQADPHFGKACDKATHLAMARETWLSRLGHFNDPPKSRDIPRLTTDQIAARFERIERAWTAYLERLDDAELARVIEYGRPTGEKWRWDVEGILTQTNGHAWYHRGQIASLVASLGGAAVDTDYIFWARPQQIA